MTKEQVYDAKIAPLMDDIIKICRDYGIAMIANFSIPDDEQDDLGCCTMIPDGEGNHPLNHIAGHKVIVAQPEVHCMAFMVTRAGS